MMVERAPYTDNMRQLIKNLDHATEKLGRINSKTHTPSKQELTDLLSVLDDINSNEPISWDTKTFSFEGMSQKLEKALLQIQLFQRKHPQEDRSGQRNVDQAIVSLSSSLKATRSKLDKELKDLRKLFRIGQRVEKPKESKESWH